MNIRHSIHQNEVEKLLRELNLSGKNEAIAREYLLAEEPDEALLKQVEPVNFRLLGLGSRVNIRMVMESMTAGSKQESLARIYRLFWTLGKSTASHVLIPVFGVDSVSMEWKISVLGKAAVAALRAEHAAHGNQPWLSAPWLWELVETEPEVLQEAQTLCGESIEGWMRLIIAGLLLCCEKLNQQKAQEQTDLILDKVLSDPSLFSRLPQADREALNNYIISGDPTAPLPPLSGNCTYIQGYQDFWQNGHTDDRPAGILGSAAFMAQNRDPRLRCAFRVQMALNPRMVMLYAFQIVPRTCILNQFQQLLEDLPGGKMTMLLFLTNHYSWMEEAWKKTLALRCADALPQVLPIADPNQFSALSTLLPAAVKAMGYDPKEKSIRFLENILDSGEEELRAYLLGTGSLADTTTQLKPVVYTSYNRPAKVAQIVQGYRMTQGFDDFVQRFAVAMGLIFGAYCIRELLAEESGRFDPELLTELSRALQRNGLPLTEHLNLLGNFHDAVYTDNEKKAALNCADELLRAADQTAELCRAAKEGSLFTRQKAIRGLSHLDTEDAKQGLLACAGDSSKAVRNLLLELLPGHPDWAPEYIALLKSKKAADRILAAMVLGKMGDVGTTALQQALEVEKNAKAADAIQNALGSAAAPPVTGAEELAQRLLHNNKIKKLQWLLESPLPAIRLTGEDQPAADHLFHAILVAYCELGRIGKSDAAAQISEKMDARDLEMAADEIYERWIEAGAPAKQKWILAFAAVYGGERVCRKLIRAIHDWPQNSRGAIACDGVKALTLSPVPEALLAVDAISRKFKFRQVRTAAAEALDSAAQELGITVEELADRIVPDLGFDEAGKRVFDYGKRSFLVRLTPSLELEIMTDAGKPLKNLPAPGKTDEEQQANDAYEQFKTMKKQIRSTITTQKTRLESALSVLRCWNAERWNALFVRNPIMHQFAISLIWGVYRDGVLTDTFRYMEDGSFNTVDEEEYQLPEQASIGLVHPVELDAELLSAWKQQLEDYEVTQSIPQLDRPVFLPAPELVSCRELEHFGGKQLNGLSLSGKLTGLGWYRGSVVDGGAFYTFWREDPSLGIGVELRFSGAFVGDENEDVTVYDAVFYRAGTVTRGSYVYDTPKEENIFTLNKIPTRYYSEIVYQLTKATASSTETDPNWKNDRRDR